MYKALLVTLLLLILKPLTCMENNSIRHQFTIVTPENIEEILNDTIFDVNNEELKRIINQKKMQVYLIKNPQECYLKVKRYETTIATYQEKKRTSVVNLFQDE